MESSDKKHQDFLKRKMEEFQSLSNTDLLSRLRLEEKKGILEEKVRGAKGATTSDTNWNINVLRMIAIDRNLGNSK
jgi:hypothetical protein